MQTPIVIAALVAMCSAQTNIVDLISKDPELSTLVTAIKAAGLDSTLSGAGPFTLFAPTNRAFEELPRGVIERLLEPSNKAELVKLLEYHVVKGAYRSSQLKNDESITTVEGENITVFLQNGHVYIHDQVRGPFAEVLRADNLASNGIVHIIGKVLFPRPAAPPGPAPSGNETILAIAEATPELSTLVNCLKASGLAADFAKPGPFTVFAPTNDAFNSLPTGVLHRLLEPGNHEELVKILSYHVVLSNVQSKDLHDAELIRTAEGQPIGVHINGGHVYLQDRRTENPTDYAEVIKADIEASNGVVHLINKVLVPQ